MNSHIHIHFSQLPIVTYISLKPELRCLRQQMPACRCGMTADTVHTGHALSSEPRVQWCYWDNTDRNSHKHLQFTKHLLWKSLIVRRSQTFLVPGNSASEFISESVCLPTPFPFLSLHKAETQLGSHNVFKLASFKFRFFKNLFTLCFKAAQKGLSLFTTQPASFWGREENDLLWNRELSE